MNEMHKKPSFSPRRQEVKPDTKTRDWSEGAQLHRAAQPVASTTPNIPSQS